MLWTVVVVVTAVQEQFFLSARGAVETCTAQCVTIVQRVTHISFCAEQKVLKVLRDCDTGGGGWKAF